MNKFTLVLRPNPNLELGRYIYRKSEKPSGLGIFVEAISWELGGNKYLVKFYHEWLKARNQLS